jgi:hypothetical protein
LDTLLLHKSNTTGGHFRLYSSLYNPPDWACKTSWSDAHFLLADDTKEITADNVLTNRQDWVFIRPPGISEGAFQLWIDNIWFCKLLLLSRLKPRPMSG